MGITIHYRGTLADTNEIGTFVEELTDIAETMKWPYSVFEDDWAEPVNPELTFNDGRADITGNLGLKGISFNPHPKSDTVWFCFDAEGNLRHPILVILLREGKLTQEQAWVSTKTHYAPPEVHITLVKLLRYLKKRYLPDLEVRDEAEYWETSDEELLKQKRKYLDEKMDLVARALESAEVDNTTGYSPEEMLELIENILTEKLGLDNLDTS